MKEGIGGKVFRATVDALRWAHNRPVANNQVYERTRTLLEGQGIDADVYTQHGVPSRPQVNTKVPRAPLGTSSTALTHLIFDRIESNLP